jgi:hypothetical protein
LLISLILHTGKGTNWTYLNLSYALILNEKETISIFTSTISQSLYFYTYSTKKIILEVGVSPLLSYATNIALKTVTKWGFSWSSISHDRS